MLQIFFRPFTLGPIMEYADVLIIEHYSPKAELAFFQQKCCIQFYIESYYHIISLINFMK